MRMTIHGKNVEVTNALKDYIEEKIGKIEKLLNDNPEINIQIQLSTFKHKHNIEVTIPLGDIVIRAEEMTEDMYKSIDLVEGKLKRKIRKLKTMANRKLKEETLNFIATIPPEDIVEEAEPELDADNGKVIRVKRFDMKPMSQEEAILQMNLLDHNFFVFTNAETNEMNVIYKRNKGEYGLIEASTILAK